MEGCLLTLLLTRQKGKESEKTAFHELESKTIPRQATCWHLSLGLFSLHNYEIHTFCYIEVT